jgi:hypothetical protein
MEVTEALAMALACAARVNVNKEEFAVSFTSLFIGLVATPDPTGHWLRAQFEQSKADLDGLLRRRGLDRDGLNRLIEAGPWTPPRSSGDAVLFTRTRSARQALDEAERRAHAAAQVTDTAQVLGALMSLRDFHDDDFKELGIDREAWSAALTAGRASSAAVSDGAPPDFDPRAPGIESHVISALQYANALAGSSPIGPSHVVAAIVRQAALSNSPAFTRLAQLVPLPSDGKVSSPGALPEAARFEEGLRRQLARAQSPKTGSPERSPIWGRDLVTAALLCDGAQAGPDLTEAGRSLESVRDLWYSFVTTDGQHRPAAEWAAWWRDANVPLPGPRRAGYTTETDQGDDKLGVDAEARAFARLILDRDVQAPLSIGLLGDWGSGKSFFIEQIKKEIVALKKEGRPELYERVVEIEFNAWHASDANLWASLVTNIFDAIWENVSSADESRDPAVARDRLQKQIEQARGAMHEAETQVQLGQQALEMAEHDLQQKREMLAWSNYVKSITTAKLKSLAKDAGWYESIETINDVENAARSLTSSGNRLRMMVAALVEKPLLHVALPTALLLVGTAAIWLLVDVSGLQVWTAKLTKLLTTVAGLAGALVVPLRVARQKVDGLADTLGGIQADYEKALEAVKKRDDAEAREVARARRELESTEARVSAARTRLAELLNEQATLDPRRRLGAFLQERVQSTQYRSQQGIISLVHKDFRELSKYMKDLRESAKDEGNPAVGTDAIRPFDRIVLYVDDLDRCRPAHVVNMLEAVHLLLALDLFVVVVAVDSRWLMRALEVYYQDLLGVADGRERDSLRESTPQNYLEKIFQITYALGSMNPARFGDYVAFLSGGEVVSKAPANPATGVDSGTSHIGDDAGPQSVQGTDRSIESMQGGGSSRGAGAQPSAAAQQPAEKKSVRASAPPVRIGQAERDFIGQLVPLLPTPRIAKRLVNVYRVIKARKSAEELDEFEREGRARTCLLMLAILFGRPAIAAELLRSLHERRTPFEKSDEPLIDALRRRRPAEGEPASVHDAWAQLIGTLENLDITETVAACAREPKEVARYSLVTGHDWHMWRSPTAN